MAIYVQHESLGKLSFPDGTDDVTITNAIVVAEAEFGEQYDSSEAFATGLVRSATSSARQIGNWLGTNQSLSDQRNDAIEEHKHRVMIEQSPKSSIGGMLVGGFLDPVTLPAVALKPLTFSSKAATYGSRGMAQGFAGGVLEPVYEQYGDSALLNIAGSTVIGGILGGGIGKLLSKADLKDEAKDAIDSVEELALTPRDALKGVEDDFIKAGKGAEEQHVLDTLAKTVDKQDRKIKALTKLAKGTSSPLKKMGVSRMLAKEKTEADLSRVRLQEMKVRREAANNLTKLQEGKYSEVDGFSNLIKAKTQVPQVAKIHSPVTKVRPLESPEMMRKLGFADEAALDSLNKRVEASKDPYGGHGSPSREPLEGEVGGTAGSASTGLDTQVGKQFLPRTADRPEVTQRIAAGKVKGDNVEPIVQVKLSTRSKEATARLDKKLARGEKPTEKDWADSYDAEMEAQILKEYQETAAKVASSRALDTAAMRGFQAGRYTFENIGKAGKVFAKKNNIKTMKDMVDYITDHPDVIFTAKELEAMKDLLMEVDNKLLRTYRMLDQLNPNSDADAVALLHSDINLYYGIQSWFKGQGTKVSAALNYRKKIYQDIADNREIDSLFAGVKC
jgi:hypothetical protein